MVLTRKNNKINKTKTKKGEKVYKARFFDVKKFLSDNSTGTINNNLSDRQIKNRIQKIIKQKKMKVGDIFYIGEEDIHDNQISINNQNEQDEGWGLVVPRNFNDIIYAKEVKTTKGYIMSDSGPDLLFSGDIPYKFIINSGIKYKNAIKSIKNWETKLINDQINNVDDEGYEIINKNKWNLFFEYGITVNDIKTRLNKYNAWD